MEALLLARSRRRGAMQQLAVRRGVVVRDYLATRELPSSRLFLGAPKVAAGDAADWKPRVDLKLTLGLGPRSDRGAPVTRRRATAGRAPRR
jgi:hypothetical protein